MKIELSPHTIELLKNYATINSELVLTPGRVLKTFSPQKNIIAQAAIDEEFPLEFAIVDLTAFIGVLTSFENPVVEFSATKTEDGCAQYILISDKQQQGQFRFFGASKRVLKSVMSGEFKMPPAVVTFDVSKPTLQRFIRTANMGQLPNIVIESNTGETVDVVITNHSIKSSNEFRLQVSNQGNGDKFHLVFDSNNFKMIPGNYQVQLDGKIVGMFKNVDRPITYFIATEKTSTYGT